MSKRQLLALKEARSALRDSVEGLDPVSGSAVPQRAISMLSRPQATQAALLSSLSGRPFEDMKLFAFSRRTRSKTIDAPLPILVNSVLLRSTSTHFDQGSVAGFSESEITNLDAPYPTIRSHVSSDYGYESDSDLEDEDEQLNAYSVTQLHPLQVPRLLDHLRKVTVPRAAMDDRLKSFVFYAYTGGITFRRLKSQGSKASPLGQTEPTSVPVCSPKSMYRLADLYDVPMLKNLARNDIKMKLSPDNILDELFSTFTSLYPEIEAFEREYLLNNIDNPVIQQKLPDWMDALAEGRLPQGAAKTVSKLILRESRAATPASQPTSGFWPV
ncbi:hypothetical protein C8T65DRAFT_741452 [Cerioporus squamosus]|nr:hypothetical protein C8T65DRAFT_741452 [Cerioporus squamosus]